MTIKIHKLYLFEDRQYINKSMPSNLVKKLNQDGLTTSDHNRVMFCGLISFDNEIAIFLPRNSDIKLIDKSKERLAAANLLKALYRYLEDKENAINTDELIDDGVLGKEYIGLVFSLFEDYFVNGLYTRRVTERKVNSGKIDWGRTVKRSTPLISGNTPVYLDLEGSVKLADSNCITAKIHAEVLRELDNKLGWLINGEDKLISSQVLDISDSNLGTTAQISHLNQELSLSYSDRDIYLLKQLITFLKLESLTQKSDFSVGVKKFEGMWEHMLASTLKNVFHINHKLVKPVYRINGILKQAKRKGQRTDIVLREPETGSFTVIDAKYYSAQSLEGAPGWPDLVKQFFYAKAIKSLYPEKDVSNVFIFPGSGGPIQSAHMAEPKSSAIFADELKDDLYPPIECVYIAPNMIISNYISMNKFFLTK